MTSAWQHDTESTSYAEHAGEYQPTVRQCSPSGKSRAWQFAVLRSARCTRYSRSAEDSTQAEGNKRVVGNKQAVDSRRQVVDNKQAVDSRQAHIGPCDSQTSRIVPRPQNC